MEGRYLSVGCGHRSLELRKGTREYYASKGCFLFRQRYSHNDQSQFPSGSLLIDY